MTFSTSLRTGLMAARIRTHMAFERMSRTMVHRLGEVPVSADQITREWLSAVLCRDTPGAEVTGFELTGTKDMGTTSRQSISVSYNDAGRAAGLPERLFAKSTPEFASRFVCGLAGSIMNEVRFYNELRPLLVGVPTPACYYAVYDPGSYRSIFLFEDAVATRGAQFLNPAYIPSRPQAEEMVRVLARLHGRFWADPALDTTFAWVSTPQQHQYRIDTLIGFKERTAIGTQRAMPLLPPRLAARAAELWPAFTKSTEIRSRSPRTLLHTDVHMGNWFRIGDEMGLCDWQTIMKGSWAIDFSYAVTSSLEVETRRAWERDLLQIYLDELVLPPGQQRPTFDEAWFCYRQQTLAGLYNWFFVAGIGEGQTEMHSSSIWHSNLTRMAVAADDLETLDALKG